MVTRPKTLALKFQGGERISNQRLMKVDLMNSQVHWVKRKNQK